MEYHSAFVDLALALLSLTGSYLLYRYNRYWIRKKKESEELTLRDFNMSMKEWMFLIILAMYGIVKIFSLFPKEI